MPIFQVDTCLTVHHLSLSLVHVVPLPLHTTYSTASFLLGIDINVNGKQVFVRNIDRDDACFESLDIDGLHTILMSIVGKHGIHNVGRMRCNGERSFLFEVDFTAAHNVFQYLKYVECGGFKKDLQNVLHPLLDVSLEAIDVSCCVLYLATPLVAQRQCHLIEVTTDNYEYCANIYYNEMVFDYRDGCSKKRPGIYA